MQICHALGYSKPAEWPTDQRIWLTLNLHFGLVAGCSLLMMNGTREDDDGRWEREWDGASGLKLRFLGWTVRNVWKWNEF